MTSAEMTRADVEAVIAAATSDQPADFTGKKLSGLDLSGLDLSGALLRAARLNRTKLNNAKLDRAILDQAWLLELPSNPSLNHLVLNFRNPGPCSPLGVLANATPRRFPLRLMTRNFVLRHVTLFLQQAFPNQP